jgi:hypothetical protein
VKKRLLLILQLSILIPFIANADVRIRDLTNVRVHHLVIEYATVSNKKVSCDDIVSHYRQILSKHKGLFYGIYEIVNENRLIVQLTSLDENIKSALIRSYEKYQFELLEERSLEGPIAFKFSNEGIFLQIKFRNAIRTPQELVSTLGLSKDTYIQRYGDTEFFIWINKRDYISIKQSFSDVNTYLGKKIKQEFALRRMNNVQSKYLKI